MTSIRDISLYLGGLLRAVFGSKDAYAKKFRCSNCARVVTVAIPVGTKVADWSGPCPNCGLTIRKRGAK